jgi:DNA-binding NtrC family response regulator
MAFVLVVDQSFESLVYLSNLLHTNGHECRLASSWKMALEHLLIEKFDIILCEYSIDGEDAFWFIRHLETLKTTSRFIIMSDDVRVKKKISEDRVKAGFCLKPIHSTDLFAQINKPV